MTAQEYIKTMKNLNIWKNFRDNMFMIEFASKGFYRIVISKNP